VAKAGFVVFAIADSPVVFAAGVPVAVAGSFALPELSGDLATSAGAEAATVATCSDGFEGSPCSSEAAVDVSPDATGGFLDDVESDIAAVTAITSPAQNNCIRIPTLTGVKNCMPSGGMLSSGDFGVVIENNRFSSPDKMEKQLNLKLTRLSSKIHSF
jgi:hypothetical protein